MNIFDMFRKASTPDQGQATQGQQIQQQQQLNPSQAAKPGQPLPGTQASATTAPNGTVPAGTYDQGQGQNQGQQSPADKFATVWDTTGVKADPEPTPVFQNIDPKKVLESAKQVDFSRVLTPEILSKITAGGQEAATAFAEALNGVAQNVYAQSAMASAKMVDTALEKQREQLTAQMPSMVKQLALQDSLKTANPLLNDPAVQPVVQALSQTLRMKHPDATVAEIQAQVNEYFGMLGERFQPKVAADKSKTKAEDDWSKFF